MKKRLAYLAIIFCLLFLFTGCRIGNKKGYRFDAKTGDSINIFMDVSNDYDISSNLPFEISQNGLVITMGAFLTEEEYDTFSEEAKTREDIIVRDSGTKDGNEYISFSYHEEELSMFTYLILIDESSTGVILKNATSEKSLKECFDRLTLELED